MAFAITVESSGCTTTQPLASETLASTIQQNSNESERKTSQAQDNQAGTAVEEKKTEGDGTTTVADMVGKVELVVA